MSDPEDEHLAGERLVLPGRPKVRKKCCRSMPRCGRCPVLVVAEARVRQRATALAEEVLHAPSQPLPPPVADALLGLSQARNRHLAACRRRARERLDPAAHSRA